MRVIVVVAVLSLFGCTVPEVNLDGRPCPCVSGYVCDTATDTCVRSASGDASADGAADARVGDTDVVDTLPGDTGAPSDAGPDVPVDTGPPCFRDDFDDPGLTGWTIVDGDWIQAGGEAIQQDQGTQIALMYANETVGTTNFRARTRMRQIDGSGGGALEINFRVDAVDPALEYFCNWEPNNAQMVLMRGLADYRTMSLEELNLDAEDSPEYNEFATFTMVLEVQGQDFRCWVEEVPGSEITASDPEYAAGAVGLKTYRMSGAYDYLEVCPLP